MNYFVKVIRDARLYLNQAYTYAVSNLNHEKSKAQPKQIVISALTFFPLNFGPKRIKVLSIIKVLWKFWSEKNKSTVYNKAVP